MCPSTPPITGRKKSDTILANQHEPMHTANQCPTSSTGKPGKRKPERAHAIVYFLPFFPPPKPAPSTLTLRRISCPPIVASTTASSDEAVL
jgi:hypothetical protein